MSTTTSATPANEEQHWVDAGEYSFRLDGENIIARNAKGRVLKTVPAKAKKTEQFEKLDALRAYLHQHDVQCADTVRQWFLKGLPVPLTVLAAVWIDPAWNKYLADLVVRAEDGTVGLLRSATKDEGLQLVDLDGETISIPWDTETCVTIPHPAVMEDIEDWREFSVELGVNQGLDQLFRDVYVKPASEDEQTAALEKYRGVRYNKAAHLMGRSRGAGFTATLNSVSLAVLEDGSDTIVTLDIDAWDPGYEAEIYALSFSRNGKNLAAKDIGPIAWSEGIRMCEFVYAGRSVTGEEDD